MVGISELSGFEASGELGFQAQEFPAMIENSRENIKWVLERKLGVARDMYGAEMALNSGITD